MIEELKRIENSEMLAMLDDVDGWKSLDVSYHPPRVERVWRQYGDHRISLHIIHPCEMDSSLVHPHPWESAMHVFETPGSVYEHGVSYNRNVEVNIQEADIVTLCRHEVIGEMYYEILSDETYHWVRPINGVVHSVMLSGPVKWAHNKWEPSQPLFPLSDVRKAEVLNKFKELYLGQNDRR